mmetsp:Transcript_2670/g.8619  ORF Transcript_2670/g.8619 Transcript_2670/m.8619 type:complete len:454 (+) Transcript_2670:975-2336(+)
MGLELELERLKSVGRDAFRLGGAQFALTSLVFGAVATAFGASGPAAIVLGGGLALSSSAFVIQLLSEKGELATRFGRASFGILLFQDIAVVPLLVVTPLLGGSSGAALGAALRVAAIKSASALAIIFVTGRLLLQRVFQLVASARDQTAFLAITLLTVLSMSAFTQALGLSDTLGAFLAGVLLAESKYRYQIEADIAPFRGLLLGLFFVTTGFSIDLPLALASAPTVVGLALALHLSKTAIVAAICTANQMKPAAALRSGLLLSQGGEFAFVIFGLAQTHGILPVGQVKLMLTVVVLSMFLTPFLNELGERQPRDSRESALFGRSGCPLSLLEKAPRASPEASRNLPGTSPEPSRNLPAQARPSRRGSRRRAAGSCCSPTPKTSTRGSMCSCAASGASGRQSASCSPQGSCATRPSTWTRTASQRRASLACPSSTATRAGRTCFAPSCRTRLS